MTPKISIITITFNSEKTLEETIKSVTDQDYEKLEYLVIDGGSKDHTLDIVSKYRDKISVVVSEPDKGISDAFNKGIQRASGEIIGIINSDDILLPGALKAIAENYDPSIDVYSGNVLIWNEYTGNEAVAKPDITFDKLKLQYGVAHPARFIRKDAYDKYGMYNIEFRYNMDGDLLCRFYKQGAKFFHIDIPLAKFRIGGTTADNIHKKKNDYRLFVKNFGGSEIEFRFIWGEALLKYYIIKFCNSLFGESFRFKYYHFMNYIRRV